MRNNQPVSSVEVSLRDDTLIVSKTDLKGQITYINKDFLAISGFTEAELIGQPHNIVRHPDMPIEAFADLWKTLKAGRPWTGMVKNRCKNGDYYWVLANAAPIIENGQVIGYISVRRKASAEMIETHELVYRQFREKKQGNLTIRFGKAVIANRISLGDWSVGAKLWGGVAVILAISVVAIASSWLGMRETEKRFAGFVGREQKLVETYSEMYAQGLQIGQALRNIILDPSNRKAIDNLEQAKKDFRLQLDQAGAVSESGEAVKQSLAQVAALSSKQFAVHERILAAVREGNLSAAQTILNSEDTPLWREYKKILLDGRESLAVREAQGRKEVEAVVARAETISLVAGLFALLLGALMAALLSRSIRRPMQEMDDTFANVLAGNYSNVIDISHNDEIGKAMQGLQVLQTRLGFEVAEVKRVADESLRVKMALDGVGMPITIADAANTLIYLNDAATALWTGMESQMAIKKPGFRVADLKNHSLVEFFDDETAKEVYRQQLTTSRTLDFGMCERHLRVTASPVRDARGDYLGRASQWLDRTGEVAVENEVASIVAAAANGDFTQRIAHEGKEGFFLQLANSLNQLLDTSQRGIDDVVHVLGSLAKGDLTQRIEADYAGSFGQMKTDANETADNLGEIVRQIKNAADAINTAAKEISSGNQDLSARTEEQASSLEETASSMEQLTSTVKQNADNARQANELAGSAQQVAEKGGAVVGQVVQTMSAIALSSHKISDIIGVIDGIAFQTNILALNAAVEAARAGEQGRGFAVVASEVRNLAQRSAAAAKEIKALIADSVDKVENGNKQVEQAGRTMTQIVGSIKGVAKIMADISGASREQSAGIEQVSLAVSQMDEVTQQNAALVEQAAAAAESLEEQAQALAQSVSVFRLADDASGSTLHAPAPRAVQQGIQRPAPNSFDMQSDEWDEF
jgi:methyl-accepting chemotaxis protein